LGDVLLYNLVSQILTNNKYSACNNRVTILFFLYSPQSEKRLILTNHQAMAAKISPNMTTLKKKDNLN